VGNQHQLTSRDQAIVDAIAKSLKPLLAEMCDKLDAICQDLSTIKAHKRTARPKPHTPARPCTRARPRTPRARTCRDTGRS
jgi:hypothetical protein